MAKLRMRQLVVALVATAGACTFDPPAKPGATTGGGVGVAGQTGAGGSVYVGGTAGSSPSATGAGGTISTTGGGPGNTVPIPAGYTNADVGAYMLGAPILPSSATTSIDSPDTGCYQLTGIVRDFKGFNEPGGHPDFEHYAGAAQTTGLVAPTLGTDRKPVYASKCESGSTLDPTACPYGPQTTSKMDFDEWYRTTDGVNLAYEVSFIS